MFKRKGIYFSGPADAEFFNDDPWGNPFGGAKMPAPK
jgi:hypothetical protein